MRVELSSREQFAGGYVDADVGVLDEEHGIRPYDAFTSLCDSDGGQLMDAPTNKKNRPIKHLILSGLSAFGIAVLVSQVLGLVAEGLLVRGMTAGTAFAFAWVLLYRDKQSNH